MRFYIFNQLMIQPFQILEGDGTPKNITGMTLKWTMMDRDGQALPDITGSIVDASTGRVSFQIPVDYFTVTQRYTCQINLTDISGYDEDTNAFTVEIDNKRKRTS